MSDEDFIAALDLPGEFPQLGQPKDPKQTKEQETHMSKHTPGPWELRNEYGMQGLIYPVGLEYPVASTTGYYLADGQRLPNARLIAAAPELLEALEETRNDLAVLRGDITDAAKECSRWDGVPEIIDAWIRRNDAAIAKARGGA